MHARCNRRPQSKTTYVVWFLYVCYYRGLKGLSNIRVLRLMPNLMLTGVIMSDKSTAERIARIVEIAERMQKHGTVYDRLPARELTKPRKLAAMSTSVPPRNARQAAEDGLDLTRSYGI